MKTEFSIIIPVYNAEEYLERCISSVINQDYKDFEVILIDDGSKDRSGTICDEYARKDNRVKVIHQINAGVSTARNVGIKNSKGTYIIFLDSDDSLKEESLARLNDTIEKNEEIDCILYNVDNKFKDGMYRGEKLTALIVQLIITEKINPPWNKVYKRNIIEENNIVFDKNIQIGEDLLFSITYLSYAENICILNEELYNYTVDNRNSLTQKYKENKYKQLMYADDEIRKYLQTFQSKRILECEKYIRLKNIFSCFMDLSHTDCSYTKKQKKIFVKKARKDNKIIIKRLGIKLYLISMIYMSLTANLILVISAKIFRKKQKQ